MSDLIPDDLLAIICLQKNGAKKKEIINIFNKYDYEITDKLWNKIKYYNINYDGVYFDKELKGWKEHSDYYRGIVTTVFKSDYGVLLPLWIKNDILKFKQIFPKENFSL